MAVKLKTDRTAAAPGPAYQPDHLVYYQESGWAQGITGNGLLAVFVDPASLGIDPYDAGAGPIPMRVDEALRRGLVDRTMGIGDYAQALMRASRWSALADLLDIVDLIWEGSCWSQRFTKIGPLGYEEQCVRAGVQDRAHYSSVSILGEMEYSCFYQPVRKPQAIADDLPRKGGHQGKAARVVSRLTPLERSLEDAGLLYDCTRTPYQAGWLIRSAYCCFITGADTPSIAERADIVASWERLLRAERIPLAPTGRPCRVDGFELVELECPLYRHFLSAKLLRLVEHHEACWHLPAYHCVLLTGARGLAVGVVAEFVPRAGHAVRYLTSRSDAGREAAEKEKPLYPGPEGNTQRFQELRQQMRSWAQRFLQTLDAEKEAISAATLYPDEASQDAVIARQRGPGWLLDDYQQRLRSLEYLESLAEHIDSLRAVLAAYTPGRHAAADRAAFQAVMNLGSWLRREEGRARDRSWYEMVQGRQWLPYRFLGLPDLVDVIGRERALWLRVLGQETFRGCDAEDGEQL